MDEQAANRIILILSVFTLIFFVIAVGSCTAARRQKGMIGQEVLKRKDLETRLAQLNQMSSGRDEELKAYQKNLEELKTDLEATRRALAQGQLINSSLKSELEKVSKLKEELEEELKQALAGRSPRGRR